MNSELSTQALDSVTGFIFDIDGTLALADRMLSGYEPLPGAVEILELLAERGIPYAAFTNGSTKTPQELARTLLKAGLPVVEHRTLTPISIAVDIFSRKKYRRILALGVEGVWKPLIEAGFDVVISPHRADDADAVLVGWHPEFRLADLDAASHAIWAGAALYTVSTAPVVASRSGRTLGISGALTAALRSITAKRAVIVGKPSLDALRVACGRLGKQAREIAIVGDDPTLENAMAMKGGAISIGVHSGLSGPAEFAALPKDLRPHYSLSGVAQLLEMLR